MGRGSILSAGLFALPIAITTGVLVGLDAFRTSQGQPRLFRNNKINVDIYCQQAFGIHPATDGQDYTCELLQFSFPAIGPEAPRPVAAEIVNTPALVGLAAHQSLVPGLTC
jgi:hypothetical protein